MVLAVALCVAADWPQFRGPGRDGVAPDVQLPAAWPKELEKRWDVPLGEGFSSPAVAGGRVFVGVRDTRHPHCWESETVENLNDQNTCR